LKKKLDVKIRFAGVTLSSTMRSTRPNLAVRIAVPCVAWALSAGMTIVLLPFLILFWLWSAITDYSDTVKKKNKSNSKGSLVSRGLGASHFIQLKVLFS
jgi:hypothetical protein